MLAKNVGHDHWIWILWLTEHVTDSSTENLGKPSGRGWIGGLSDGAESLSKCDCGLGMYIAKSCIFELPWARDEKNYCIWQP
jgi:hypothetical protein